MEGLRHAAQSQFTRGKGYSYGVFSNPVLFQKGGAWIASGGVQTNKTTESAVEFINELKNLAGAKPIRKRN
jgi:hypothetical protein